MRRMRVRGIVVGCVLAVVAAAAVTVPAAGAAPGRGGAEPPPDREAFPDCTEERVTYCVVSFETDPAGTGEFGPPPDGVSVHAEFWAAFVESDSFNLLFRNGVSGDLAPALPAGAGIRVVVNTGDWEPPSTLSSRSRVRSWTRSFDEVTGWTMAFELNTLRATLALNCSLSEGCDAPTDLLDIASVADATIFADPTGLDEFNQAIWDMSEGSWVGTNASAFSGAYYDSESLSIAIQMAGPHFTAAGEPELNTGFMGFFVPDAIITGFWGVTSEAIVAGGMTVTRTDGDLTERVQATVTREDGGVLVEVSDFHFSAPEFTFQLRPVPKAVVANARGGVRRAVVRAEFIPGLVSYEAKCRNGARVVTAANEGPRVVVRPLRAGAWTCRIRGERGITGRWSDPVTVTVLPRP